MLPSCCCFWQPSPNMQLNKILCELHGLIEWCVYIGFINWILCCCCCYHCCFWQSSPNIQLNKICALHGLTEWCVFVGFINWILSQKQFTDTTDCGKHCHFISLTWTLWRSASTCSCPRLEWWDETRDRKLVCHIIHLLNVWTREITATSSSSVFPPWSWVHHFEWDFCACDGLLSNHIGSHIPSSCMVSGHCFCCC